MRMRNGKTRAQSDERHIRDRSRSWCLFLLDRTRFRRRSRQMFVGTRRVSERHSVHGTRCRWCGQDLVQQSGDITQQELELVIQRPLVYLVSI